MDKNEKIKDARNELESVSGDYEIRRIAELKEKYIRDEKAALAYAKEEGFDKGFEEGKQAGINYNVPIVVDTLRRREPINWTQFEGIKS